MIDKSLWLPPSGDIPLDVPEQIAAKYSGSSGSSESSGSSPQPQDKSVAAAIISGVVALGSAIIGGVSAHRANQTNINLTREAYARNLEQWERENAYNTPLAQRQRLMAANFNPALMYGGSGSLGTPAAASPQQESAKVNPYIFGNPLQGFPSDIAQMELLEAQKENIQADTKKKLAETGLTEIQSQNALVKLSVDKDWLARLTEDQHKQFVANVDKIGVEISEINQKINNLKAEEALKLLEGKKLQSYIDNIQPAELDKIIADTNLSKAQAKEILSLMGQKYLLLKAQTYAANSAGVASVEQARYTALMGDFQQKLNDSPDYVQSFVNKLHWDAENSRADFVIKDLEHGGVMDAGTFTREAAAVFYGLLRSFGYIF